ncbi:MAG TPA: hypothetical protein VHR66_26310 [Gemmataceae bacterium]|nr:hypothetical protein [Gemmataceae bacterium]
MLRFLSRSLCFILPLVVCVSVALAQPAQVVWQPTYAMAEQQAKKSGLPMFALVLAKNEKPPAVVADPKVGGRLQSFICVIVTPDSATAKKFDGIAGCAFFLDAKGESLAKLDAGFDAAKLLDKIKETAELCQTQFMERLKNPKADAASQKAAIDGYIRLGGPVANLVPMLGHKNGEVRLSIRKLVVARINEGLDWSLFNALASPEAEIREASFPVLVEATHATKVRPVKFWKDGSEEERTTELDKWRETVFGKTPGANKAVLDFINANYGTQVKSGECADLAGEAIAAAKAQPMKIDGKTYIWGQPLTKNDNGLAGDIVQMEDAKFSNGNIAPHHTQVIRKVLGPGQYEVLEQNVSGRRTVGLGKLNVKLLTQGTVVIYRPIPMDGANK